NRESRRPLLTRCPSCVQKSSSKSPVSGGSLTRASIACYLEIIEASMAASDDVKALSKGDEILLGDTAILTRLDKALGWARKFSIFPYPFATACCAMEYMSLTMTPYDIDRFGALLPRFTPRQADLLMVIGTVSVRQGPILRRVYEQMGEPKWVMAFGACASS